MQNLAFHRFTLNHVVAELFSLLFNGSIWPPLVGPRTSTYKRILFTGEEKDDVVGRG